MGRLVVSSSKSVYDVNQEEERERERERERKCEKHNDKFCRDQSVRLSKYISRLFTIFRRAAAAIFLPSQEKEVLNFFYW
jgi:hypothetical protein